MVRIGDLRYDFELRKLDWSAEHRGLKERRDRLTLIDFPRMQIDALLAQASTQERSNLATILGIGTTASGAELANSIRRAGSHSVASVVRRAHVEYAEVAADVAKKAGDSAVNLSLIHI